MAGNFVPAELNTGGWGIILVSTPFLKRLFFALKPHLE